MSVNLEATVLTPFADEDPFEYGDRTVLQLRAQPFEVQDAFGTVVTMPIDTAPRNPLAAVPADTVFVEEDPIARLERKLDASLQQIVLLQQRIESLDTTLARVLALARTS
jgi:hypothetical protein